MKFFATTFCLVLAAAYCSADGNLGKLNRYRHECAAANGISDEVLRKVVNREEVEITEALKKHGLCLMKKIHFMDEHGELTKESMKRVLTKVMDNDETKVDEMITKCAIKRDTPEDTAVKMITCMRAETPKFLPASI